ncbi:MAG: hypothetical protein FWD44_10190, partial [Oscillospiraceae bacterium]|nr:hypothetical protein [Oscillospiraceae bacterium]
PQTPECSADRTVAHNVVGIKKRSPKEHLKTPFTSYTFVYVVLTHMQGGEGGDPSRLPPTSRRGTFVSCYGL